MAAGNEQTGLLLQDFFDLKFVDRVDGAGNLNFHTRAVTALLNARIVPRLTGLLADLEKVLAAKGIKHRP